ncbi:MAG: AAA family ATPase [Planctomycetia bacterium]|nr:AAA family ATPase [Planctomycetia bacterium]
MSHALADPAPDTAVPVLGEARPPSADPTEMRPGLTAEEVCRRLARAARHEETGRRVLAFYLVEMDQRRLYQATGHGSTAHYAEARLGLDRRRVAELVRVGAKLLELRGLDRAFCAGRLGWAKVLIVARMATPEHEAAWLERALALDARALALLAARSREGGAPRAPGDEKGLPEIRFPVSASVGSLVYAKLEQAQRRLGAELGREVDVAGLLDTLLDQFLATQADGSVPGRTRVDASAFRVQLVETGERGAPLLVSTEDGLFPLDAGGPGGEGAASEAVRCDAGVRNHHVAGSRDAAGDDHDHRARDVKTPPGMRRSVLRRDGHRCRSCRSRWSLMVHHVEFRSHGGRTLHENLITLCSRCHGLVHAGLLVIEGTSADVVRFVDAAGRPLAGAEQVGALEASRLATWGAEAVGLATVSLQPPPVAPDAPEGAATVTLRSMPEEVDASWWRRHAHLVRERGEHGTLRFEAGTPIEAPAPDVAPPAPVDTAFAGLVGQGERVARLARVAEGVRARGKRFPHVLLTGPAGTGKSTLARGIAVATGRPIAEVSAPLVTDRATWVRLLAGLAEGSVLFLDEAHALPRALLEVLLEAMAEHRLSLVLSDGVTARRIALKLPSFTLVAATTDDGAIPPALRSRFGLRETLVHYDADALAAVVRDAAAREGAEATPEGARRLAEAARGTPREALRLLERALDDAAADGAMRLDVSGVERTLSGLGYDANGLDAGEQRYLAVLRESPMPVPLSRLARVMGTTPRSLVEHVEPWLFLRGFARMTPGGRTTAPRVRLMAARGGAPNVRHLAPRAYHAT